jgi:hypothetical protein
LKSLIKILLILSVIPALAQEDKYTVVMDSTEGFKKWSPTGLRLGVELLGPALYFVDDRNLNYEFTAEMDFDQYYLIAEVGFQQFQEVNNSVSYDMRGSYFRIGPEANFLHRDRLLNNFSFGLRYAWSSYNEIAIGQIEEPNWGNIPVNFNVDNRSWWVEMTTGVKVRLVKNVFTGYILRFRFMRSSTVPDVPFTSYFVPGYGYADRINTWGFRYYIMYRFQWKVKPVRAKRKRD